MGIRDKFKKHGVNPAPARKGSATETDEAQFLRQVNEQIAIVEKAIETGEPPKTRNVKTKEVKSGWNRAHWVKPDVRTGYNVSFGFPAIKIEGNIAIHVDDLPAALEVLKEGKAELPADKEFMKAWNEKRAARKRK